MWNPLPLETSGTTTTTSWTPVLTFATPGTLVKTIDVSSGSFVQIGKTVIAQYAVSISGFNKGTASGEVRIGGLPFPSATPGLGVAAPIGQGFMTSTGSTLTWPTGATMMACGVPGSGLSYITIYGMGSAVAGQTVTASNFASGSVAVNLAGCVIYTVD